MQETGSKSRISIRVASEAYLFSNDSARSEWLGAARIFATEEFQRRYDDVEISVFNHKFTLIPEHFVGDPIKQLSAVVKLSPQDKITSKALAEYGAVAIYSSTTGETMSGVIADMVLRTDGNKAEVLPEQYHILKSLPEIPEYNKVIASYADGRLYLGVAQGRTLLLCNSFEAADFTTAEYYIFSVLRKFQMNPEVTTIWFRTALCEEQEQSLYNYFKQVELL